MFEPSRPARFGDARGSDPERLECHCGDHGVIHLMVASERALDSRKAAPARIDLEIANLEFGRTPQRNPELRCLCLQHRLGLRPLSCDYRRNAALENARLLARDGFDRLAQEHLMVQVNGRDHSEYRLDHICRIQPTAQAYFDYRRLDAQLTKQPECHGCDGLKITRMFVNF